MHTIVHTPVHIGLEVTARGQDCVWFILRCTFKYLCIEDFMVQTWYVILLNVFDLFYGSANKCGKFEEIDA